jgi:hypothetical protein
MGYPYLMRKAFLTPLLISGLLLLPSCSGNNEQAKCEDIQRVVTAKKSETNSLLQAANTARAVGNWDVALDLAGQFNVKITEVSKTVYANKSCFLDSEITEAENWIEE